MRIDTESYLRRSSPTSKRGSVVWIILALATLLLTALASATTTSLDKIDVETSVGKQVEALANKMEMKKFVLLLHGARFSSADWKRIGTLDKIKDTGFIPVAVDLKKESVWTDSPESWLKQKVEELEAGGTNKVVIVSPSMSGKGALPFVVANSESVYGFVPIAPVDPFPQNKLGLFHNIKTKTLILFGANDEGGKRVSKVLEGVFDDPKVVEIKDAGHACYLDQPEVFHKELQEFLRSLP